jgi:hypothetical protein
MPRQYKLDLVTNQGNGYPYNTTWNFRPQINLPERCEVALYSISMFNSNPNISANLGNQTLKYSKDSGATYTTITIPQGSYGIDALSTQINALIVASGGVQNNVILTGNYATLKVDITLTSTYRLDFSVGNFYKLIGWTAGVVSSSGTGSTIADLTNGIVSYSINSNLVSGQGSYLSGTQSNALYTFVPNVPSGLLIDITVQNLLFVEMSTKTIGSLNITITDQANNLLVDLSSEPIRYTLIVREIQN